MKKAKEIEIREYPSNIEVFIHEPEELIGRVYLVECTGDTIPSASYVPTIDEIVAEAHNILTRAQASEIKKHIYSHCSQWCQ